MLLLVRHAMPAATSTIPPRRWVLSRDGEAAAVELRAVLPVDSYLVSSDETRTWQTLGGQIGHVARDPRLNEVARTGERWRDDFQVARRAYVEGDPHPGWESHRLVVERFSEAVRDHASTAAGRPLVMASHGMAMATWLASRLAMTPAEAGAFWADLRFPDCHRVDLEGRKVQRHRETF